jgi:hypothetical protein
MQPKTNVMQREDEFKYGDYFVFLTDKLLW